MHNDFIDMIEDVPKLKSTKCKFIANAIWFGLKFSIYIAGLITWYLYDYFIAFGVFTLSFIVMGIVRSKLRNAAIPLNQIEFSHDDKSIAIWFSAKRLCF
jgi:hypothetical protein